MVSTMQKDIIIQRLRERGCRITRQRLMLLDIILEEDCSSCKEIFYKASKIDKTIGTATVYRMINTLEEVGAISRKNMYRVACCTDDCERQACTVYLRDGGVLDLTGAVWNRVIQEGLKACHLIREGQRVSSVEAGSCECHDTCESKAKRGGASHPVRRTNG